METKKNIIREEMYSFESQTVTLPLERTDSCLPFFSIIVPLYNKALFIERTINSVLRQSCPQFELIIIDDGSTDTGAQIVADSFDDKRIKLIRKKNGGVSSARNMGMKEAKGEFIYFLDADDTMVFDCLESFDKLIKLYPGYDVYASNFFITKGGEERPFLPSINGEFVILSPYKAIRLGELFLRVGNNVVRKRHAEKFLFDEKICIYEDMDYFLRLIADQVIPFTSKCLYRYSLSNAELSLSNKHIQQTFAYHASIECKLTDKNLIISDNVAITIWSKIRFHKFTDAAKLLWRHKWRLGHLFIAGIYHVQRRR